MAEGAPWGWAGAAGATAAGGTAGNAAGGEAAVGGGGMSAVLGLPPVKRYGFLSRAKPSTTVKDSATAPIMISLSLRVRAMRPTPCCA